MHHLVRNHACCAGAARGSFALPGDTPKYERDLPFGFSQLLLELDVDVERARLSGIATLDFERKNAAARQLSLDAVDFEIAAVEVSTGKGFKPASFEYDDRVLSVRVEARVHRGQLRIRYSCQPQRGLYFLKPDETVPNRPVQVWSQCQDEDARHWFPCHDKPHVKTPVSMRVKVPSDFDVLCNGERTSDKRLRKGRQRLACYEIKEPVPSYLVTLVIGSFEVVKDRAAVLPDGREVPVEYWVPEGRAADARRAFGETPRMIELFSRLTGVPYPFSRYTQVVVADFIFGGMENTTATTMYEHVLLDKRAAIDIDSHDLVAHELAHQWFGDWVTCRDWIHGWLNEGFASYFEHVEREDRLDRDEYLLGLERDLRSYLSESRERYSRAIVTRQYDEPLDLFDRHLYEKGALVLHLLRQRLGTATFWGAVSSYLARHGRGHAATTDLKAALEDAAGVSLDRFFDEWVHRAGHPKLRVRISTRSDAVVVAFEQRQERVFELFITVEVMHADGKVQAIEHRTSEAHSALTIPTKGRPNYVAVDPELTVLGELDVQAPTPLVRGQLAKGSSPRVRRLAARLLRSKRDFKTTQALSKVLGSNRNHYSVRVAAAAALGAHRSDAALSALLSTLPLREPRVRAAVASALGEFESDAAAKGLQQIIREERSYLVEAAACRALGKTRRAEAAAVLLGHIRSESWASVVGCACVDGLVALDDPKYASAIKDVTEYGVPSRLRRTAVRGLVRLDPSPTHLRHLRRMLRDSHPHVRMEIASALADSRAPEELVALREHLAVEADARVRRRLREVLRRSDDRSSTAELTKRLGRLEHKLAELEGRLAKHEVGTS